MISAVVLVVVHVVVLMLVLVAFPVRTCVVVCSSRRRSRTVGRRWDQARLRRRRRHCTLRPYRRRD